ncbi:unnamed protein product [Ectocarpus sp. 13 AM-2016]
MPSRDLHVSGTNKLLAGCSCIQIPTEGSLYRRKSSRRAPNNGASPFIGSISIHVSTKYLSLLCLLLRVLSSPLAAVLSLPHSGRETLYIPKLHLPCRDDRGIELP